jgi:hypothetical protein
VKWRKRWRKFSRKGFDKAADKQFFIFFVHSIGADINTKFQKGIYCITTKIIIMKTAGWILIALGILMILIKGFSVPVKKTLVDVGPIEINKTENHWIGWPTYAGGALAIVGVVMVATSRKSS